MVPRHDNAGTYLDPHADVQRLDMHQIIRAWHEHNPDGLRGQPGYSNVYVVADSFEAFVLSLEPTEEPE